MPIKVTNEDGEEIDALSQEEADKLAQERVQAEVKRIEEEKQAELDRIAGEKKAIEDELEKLKSKDMNFEHLRKKAEGKESAINEALEARIEELNAKIETIAQQPKEDVKQDFINQNIDPTDSEQRERFDYYYEKLGADAKTKTEVLKAAEAAMRLATDGAYKPNTDSAMYRTGVNQTFEKPDKKEISEESKAMGEHFGVTDADRKKYGKK